MENVTSSLSSFVTNQTILETDYSEEDTDYQDEDLVNLIFYLNIASMVSFSITFLLGVAGNGLVIWVGAFKMTRTVNVIWFLNLAIADFIFDVFLPLHIVTIAMDEHWPFGGVLCKVSNTVLWLNMLASISFLVVISIDRCVSVVSPFWSRIHRTPRLAYMVAFATWLLAVILSAPYLPFYDIEQIANYSYCFMSYAIPWEDYSDRAMYIANMRHNAMVTTRFISMFLVPFVIIIICYGVIALKIKQRKHPATSSRPFKIIITILVLFFICWFPFHVFPFLDILEIGTGWAYKLRIVVYTLAPCLAYANSCLNPILYVFIGRNFKDTFRRSILSVFDRAFNEEPAMAQRDTRSPSKFLTEVDSPLL